MSGKAGCHETEKESEKAYSLHNLFHVQSVLVHNRRSGR